MNRLAGKVCVVTGAARGIGRAAARRMAREGAVVYGADREIVELQHEMDLLRQEGHHVYAVALDLRQVETIDNLAQQVLAQQGRIDVLANVAGVIVEKHLEETSLAEWDALLEINLRGPFLTCRAFATAMKSAGAGSIINVSSRAGVMGFPMRLLTVLRRGASRGCRGL